ncbi:MAG: WYL domain-containing protein [Chitinophagales bacterium]|nr:WYL domain-containing protein [Chitinophagales bacterium]
MYRKHTFVWLSFNPLNKTMYENSTYSKRGDARKQMHYSPNLLSTINNAIDNCKLSTIEYDSREKGITIRDIEPMAIVYKDRKRHLVGWCHLRGDYRSFRLDRLNLIKLKQEEFQRRQDFNINDHQDAPGMYNEEEYDEES